MGRSGETSFLIYFVQAASKGRYVIDNWIYGFNSVPSLGWKQYNGITSFPHGSFSYMDKLICSIDTEADKQEHFIILYVSPSHCQRMDKYPLKAD